MELIKNNPYRIVGLLVGATAKEQERQIRRLKQFIEAEHEAEEDFSFPALGKIIRTLDTVSDSASKLNLDSDKMNASLFWFYNGNPITDEPAFDALKDSNLEQTINIWTKLTSAAEITHRNASAFSNLATLYLNHNTDENCFDLGISLKLKFLESEFMKDIKAVATDETYKTTKKELQLIFLNQIQSEIDSNNGIKANKFLEILNKQTFSAKEDFLKSYSQRYIEQIERIIEETRKKQKANPAKAGDYGNELYKTSKPLLTCIISILGKSDIKIISVSDKIANEVLQCSINLFNHFHESATEVGEIALDLNKKAKSIALGSVIRERINESSPIVERYINERSEREKQAKILIDLEAWKNLIDEYERKSETIENAKALINKSKPILLNIKSVLGSVDNLYLKLSTRVASQAQSYVINEVNRVQENLTLEFLNDPNATINKLKSTLNQAWEVTLLIGTLDMEHDFRTNRYNPNKETLKSLIEQLVSPTPPPRRPYPTTSPPTNKPTTSPKSPNSGCYIATMAFGNYDHPQVIILRKYRDEVLSKSNFGKWFIKTYYFYSPQMVEKMKNKKTLNIIIRKSLNQVIKLIK